MVVKYGDIYPRENIEKVHRDFLRSLLHVKTTTLNEFVYREFGRRPLLYNRYYRIVK